MKRSDLLFLVAAFFSFLFSIYLWFQGQREEGIFVGIWVPSILSAAVLIKQIINQESTNKWFQTRSSSYLVQLCLPFGLLVQLSSLESLVSDGNRTERIPVTYNHIQYVQFEFTNASEKYQGKSLSCNVPIYSENPAMEPFLE